jgi:hypothetical protein
MSAAAKKCDGLCNGHCQEDIYICAHIHGFVEWIRRRHCLAHSLQVLINTCRNFDPGAGSQDVRDMPRLEFSSVAMSIYTYITGRNIQEYLYSSSYTGDISSIDEFRTDAIMIKIYKYFDSDKADNITYKDDSNYCMYSHGNGASAKYCELSLETIKPGYETFYKIEKDECGGESIVYNTDAYALSQLRTKLLTIVKDASRSEAKRLAAIAAILAKLTHKIDTTLF